MSTPKSVGHPIVARAGSLKLTVWSLLMLLVLTVWGTLYQADHGLYEAQSRFYYSWGFLAGGWMPLPGGQLVMAVLFVNLSASILDLGLRRRLSGGFLLTHGGLILMLGAGGLIFLIGEHSQLALLEGHGSNISVASDAWEVAVWRTDADRYEREITAFTTTSCTPGSRLVLPDGGMVLTVEAIHDNATKSVTGDGLVLLAKPPSSERGLNRPGVQLSYTGANDQPATILLHAEDPRAQIVEWGSGERRVLALRRRTFPLPATIQLIDFQKEVYPGTQTPRVFASVVRLRDGDLEREVRISMNKPMRHRGFTFYQSSYQQLGDGREVTVLAVVKNYARHLPYLATLLTGLGMTLHFTGRMMAYLRRTRSADRRLS